MLNHIGSMPKTIKLSNAYPNVILTAQWHRSLERNSKDEQTLGMNKKIGLAAAVILALGCITAARYVSHSSTELEPSPIGRLKPNVDQPSNTFENRLKPVPELVLRSDTAKLAFVPHHHLQLSRLEALAAPMRDQQEKGPSGLWKLTNFYYGLRDQINLSFHWPEDENNFNSVFAEWESLNPNKSSSPYIAKAYVLRKLLDRAMYDAYEAAKSGKPTAELQARVNDRNTQLFAFLNASKQIAQNDPGFYLVYIASLGKLCMPFEKVYEVLEEGSIKFPNFHQLYFEALSVGMECQDDDRFQVVLKKIVDLGIARTQAVDGQAMYARTMWYLSSLIGDAAFSNEVVVWSRMKQGMYDVLKRYPDAWNVNNFARFACVAHDAQTARDLLPKALELPVLEVWKTTNNFDACRSWAMSTANSDLPAVTK